MSRSSSIALASLLAFTSLMCALGVARAQTTYTLTQVGTNDSTTSTTVGAINDEGDLGLTVRSGSTTNVYLWRAGTQTNIGGLAPSPQLVEGGALNDRVQVVGTTISPTSGNFCGFVWQHGQMTELPTPAGSPAVFAFAVNLPGQIAGQAFDANFNAQTALWDHGQITLFPGIAGGDYSQPVAINIRGEIFGFSFDAANNPSTVVWRHGTLTVLIPGVIPSGVNDRGQIVGTSATGTPYLWQNGTLTTLPSLPGLLANGTAQAINDWGQIVGAVGGFPVVWMNGSPVELNSQIATTDPLRPYVHLDLGKLINNLGQIVATGVDSRTSNITNYYMLTPAR